MSQRFTCAQGHHWERDETAPTPSASLVCPVCGLPAAGVPDSTLSLDGGASPAGSPASSTLPLHLAAPADHATVREATSPEAPGAGPSAQTVTLAGLPAAVEPVDVEALRAAFDQPPAAADATEAAKDAGDQPPPPQTGTVPPAVPGYEILGVLGRGGMGVVYRARQVSLKRVVALKMILAGAHAGPAQLARFRSEAEAVAKLQHPNIVQVYEVGEQGGLPYFSLEYVDGGSLDERLKATPQPPALAAPLVEQLARAVHYAHQRGIVHRDLKPANILLAFSRSPEASGGSALASGERLNEAVPKITDFGLAKQLQEGGGQTQSGSILGTPSYMAPEQASGAVHEVGPATDVYALGAILYEMLTGRPPFRAATALDTVNQVISQEPVPPTRLNAKVPRDLETICLKCLHKEPRRRYASAGDLAEDLRRFQAREPILARPTPAWERAVKWARRRPAVAALVLVIGVAVLSLLVGGYWYNTRLRLERDRAERNLDKALQAVEEMLTEVGARGLADEPLMEEKRRALLEKALPFYRDFLREKSDDPALRKKAGRAYRHMGDIYRLLGRSAEAEEAYHRSIDLLSRVAEDYPDEADTWENLADTYNWLGELLRTDHPPEATAAYEKALAIQEKLVADFPNSPDRFGYRKEKARSLYNLGLVLKDTNQPAKAKRAFGQAIAILAELARRFQDEPAFRQELARAYLNRGPVLRVTDGFSQALASYDEAVNLLRQLVKQFYRVRDYRHELAVSHNNRGNLLQDEARLLQAKKRGEEAADLFRRAEGEHRQAQDLFQKLGTDFPSVPVYQKELANTYNSLGAVRYSTRGPEEAAKAWAEAEALLRNLVKRFPKGSEYHALLGHTLGNLGLHWMDEKSKDLDKARRYFEQAVHHFDRALEANRKNPYYRQGLSQQYRNLAETLVELKDHAAAVKAAKALAEVFGTRGLDCYYAACFVSRCVPLAAEASVRQQYTNQVVALLRSAATLGVDPDKRLKGIEEKYIRPLDNEAIPRLLADLDSRPASGR